jgi:hypothetical protein
MLLADSPSGLPLPLLMDALTVVLALSFLLVRWR